MTEIIIAIGIVFVIEGFLYALFPTSMKNMMKMALEQSENALRARWSGRGVYWSGDNICLKVTGLFVTLRIITVISSYLMIKCKPSNNKS